MRIYSRWTSHINVYFPCFEAGLEYQMALLDCLGYIENCMICNNYDGMIILGDFNFECKDRSTGYKILRNLLEDYKLKCCEDSVDGGIDYTYFQDTLGRYSVIDHMFTDEKLYNSIIKYYVVESGVNFSDHVPIACTFGLLNYVHDDKNSNQHRREKHKASCEVLRWDKGDLALYYEYTGQLLQSMSVPYHLLSCKCDVQSCMHVADINYFYNQLVAVLNCSAMHAIPMIRCDSRKPYWTGELQELKEDSVQAHKAWIAQGKPRQGWLNKLRLQSKYKYKVAIREAALTFEWDVDDELSQAYLRKDMDKFWKKWQQRFGKKNTVPPHIGGNTDSVGIAQQFKQAFTASCFDSYTDRQSISELKDRLEKVDNRDIVKNVFDVTDIEKALVCIKSGKAAGVDNITKEHLVNSHPALIVYLMILFNIMTVHGVVPDGFGVGVVIPIVKDKSGDITDVNNYRGITLCPVISKLFEYCLIHKYDSYMATSDLQFGFKKNLGCSHAVFALRQCVEYFVARGSTVFMAALDAQKAFDRVNHVKLFSRMCEIGVPAHVIRLIMNWYSNIIMIVKWENSYSDACSIKCGVRQGGVLSPVLFNVYFNVLVKSLERSKLGCHVYGEYIGCIVYADDIILLSASVINLQKNA